MTRGCGTRDADGIFMGGGEVSKSFLRFAGRAEIAPRNRSLACVACWSQLGHCSQERRELFALKLAWTHSEWVKFGSDCALTVRAYSINC